MTTEPVLSAMEPAGWRYSSPHGVEYEPLRQSIEYKGWTETRLFTEHQLIAAVKADRAAIVAWLRNEGTLQIDTGYDAGVYGGQGMHFAADQIEARAYIPTPPSQDTQP